ncbi:MAG: hypothetical protein HKN68_12740 [Saprospiraceae bacterium]|nr:hypothetical protein [Saprospiraceae bacterium]
MIYLQNGPDTLRVTGTKPSTDDINLKSGWNWIGFPFQNPETVNDVLNLNAANSTGEDRIKNDFPLPDETASFANYSLVNDNWNDGNLDLMEPGNLYKLFSGHPNGAILSWTPENNNMREDRIKETTRSSPVVDPNDANTWMSPNYASDELMPIIAYVTIDGLEVSDINDKVAFFENDTIRALGEITFVPMLSAFRVNFLVEKASGNFDIRLFDSSDGLI